MQAAVYAGVNRIEWRDLPTPTVQGAGEVLVRPLIVGRCDLDVAYVRGQMPMPVGSPIGHEIIGEIIDVGSDASGFSLGQRVFVPAQISCGACSMCQRGMTGRCEAVPFGASYGMGREGGFGGGLADVVRVPFAKAMLTPVPTAADAGCLIGAADMAADAWRAVGPALLDNPGVRVLVIGGNPAVIGLYAVGIAIAQNAGEVAYIDGDPARRTIAQIYGATVVEEPSGFYPIVVVASPLARSLDLAFAHVAPGGLVTSVAPTVDVAPSLETRALYHKGVTWKIGRPDCRSGRDGALTSWALSGFRPDVVPTKFVSWENAAEAWSDDAIYIAARRD